MPRRDLPPDAPLCASGKVPFRTEEEAQAGLASARYLRGQDLGHGRRPGTAEAGYYLCAACSWWHLSSTTRAGRRGTYANRKGRRR